MMRLYTKRGDLASHDGHVRERQAESDAAASLAVGILHLRKRQQDEVPRPLGMTDRPIR
jgi:hypothetical protein